MTPIKRGTARRLGLSRSTYTVLATLRGNPLGPLRTVAAVGRTAARSFVMDAKGSAVHDTGVVITAGMVHDQRVQRAVA